MASRKKKLRKLAKKQAKKKKTVKKKMTRRSDTWRKKTWYKILAPKLFDEKQIGETIALRPQNLEGRKIKTPLSVFTNKIHHQLTLLTFKLGEIKGQTAYTKLLGYEVTRDALRRNIRRRSSAIKTILNLTTKDKRKIRMTAYIFTLSKVDTLKQKSLRKIMDEQIRNYVSKCNYQKVFQDSIYGELASSIYKTVKKLQRIKKVEITKIKTIS